VIGPKLELTYPYQHVGEGAPALGEALSGGANGLLVSQSVTALLSRSYAALPIQRN